MNPQETLLRDRQPHGRCFESHEPLKITHEGTDYLIYGGSCSNPMVLNADVYVGFERSVKDSKRRFPWYEGASFEFYIPDRGVPADIAEFKNLVAYLALMLHDGKRVHLGCIGGHGRTGLTLAALVMVMTGNKDAIKYVRDHYCQKAVESMAQVNFLIDNFGCNHHEPSDLGHKAPAHGHAYNGHHGQSGGITTHHRAPAHKAQQSAKQAPVRSIPKGEFSVIPVRVAPACIWSSDIRPKYENNLANAETMV